MKHRTIEINQNQGYHSGQSQSTQTIQKNQSKLEAITYSRHEEQENVRERITIGFGFISDWLRGWREFVFQSIFNHEKTNLKRKNKMHSSVMKHIIAGQLVFRSTAGFNEPSEHDVKQLILSKKFPSFLEQPDSMNRQNMTLNNGYFQKIPTRTQ